MKRKIRSLQVGTLGETACGAALPCLKSIEDDEGNAVIERLLGV